MSYGIAGGCGIKNTRTSTKARKKIPRMSGFGGNVLGMAEDFFARLVRNI